MKWARHRRARYLLASLALVVAIAFLIARLSRVSRDGRKEVANWSRSQPPVNSGNTAAAPSPSATSPLPSAEQSPTLSATPGKLIIPVAGVRPDQLRDTFSEARAEGRVHDAIDIPAPLGTPVLAVADGPILKLFHSERGGTTIYQLSNDGKFVYYYAHLDRYAEGLAEDHFARQGETIAYVGDTGNAGAGNYHLHFSVALISDPRHYWQGVNLNPYPLLRK